MLFAHLLGLLLLFLLGWGLGWVALHNWRLALLPAILTVLLHQFGDLQSRLGNPSDAAVFVLPIFLLAFFLWSLTRLPLLPVARVVYVSVVVPLLALSLMFGVTLLLLKQVP